MTLSRQWDNKSIIIEMQLRGKSEQCSSANRIADKTVKIPQHSVHFNVIAKNLKLQQKAIFLKRCSDYRILLPSNFQKHVDLDLLLIQQDRRLRENLHQISITLRSFSFNWNLIPYNIIAELKHIQVSSKLYYIHKFDWLWSKQKDQILKAKILSRQKLKNKKSTLRYRNRKKKRKTAQTLIRANAIILNKSNFHLSDAYKLLLLRGLNYAPTPKWTNNTEDAEWFNLIKHLRRTEWAEIYKDEITSNDSADIPHKLKIPKLNRPNKDCLNDRILTYEELVTSKLRNLKPLAIDLYDNKNNLSGPLRTGLKELSIAVRNRRIVICRSDKDGRIIIVNFDDYNSIMSKELTSFHRLNDLNQQNYVAELDKIREVGDNFIVNLHKCCFIDDDLLKHISGIKKYDTAYKRISDPEQRGNYRKIPGPIAKHFACNQPAYAYPLFKTHKISPNDLQDISVFEIPVRLLQSAGFITTSRFTAYQEFLL